MEAFTIRGSLNLDEIGWVLAIMIGKEVTNSQKKSENMHLTDFTRGSLTFEIGWCGQSRFEKGLNILQSMIKNVHTELAEKNQGSFTWMKLGGWR